MLNHEDNELLCRVGPGTPMGNLMREYWIPALPSSEFPGPDCEPKRMRLLGETFVMFRDSKGRMGALHESCPHRGASLYFGRNEECGLRCGYHGWKFDLEGNCVDLPTEEGVRGENMRSNIKARAFPCREAGRMVWVYMGERKDPPPFPEFEINTLPIENVAEPCIMMEEANWLQDLEGDLDSAHLDWLHSRLAEDSAPPDVGIPGFWSTEDRIPPRLDVETTNYGAYYTAKRPFGDGQEWHRINHFMFPFHTLISHDDRVALRTFVPIDDDHAMIVWLTGHPTKALSEEEIAAPAKMFDAVGGFIERTNDPRTYFMTKANKRNDYGRDMKMQEEQMFVGVPFVANLQDRMMTELMCNDKGEFIYDRTKEHLGSSDAMVIAVRRQLLNAVRSHRDEGKTPDNLDDVKLHRLRPASLNLAVDADWKSESETARNADSGQPVSIDVATIL
jgi:phenylpropionate dioxygenase-like ring-hydroxylating dioxygenase large terminal subunit